VAKSQSCKSRLLSSSEAHVGEEGYSSFLSPGRVFVVSAIAAELAFGPKPSDEMVSFLWFTAARKKLFSKGAERNFTLNCRCLGELLQ
jgi:hypothetical protein